MLLKRYFWATNLALITLFVWASVNLFLTLVSTKLDQRPLPRPLTSRAQPQEPEKKSKAYFTMLASHNVFDPYGEGRVERTELEQPEDLPPLPPPTPISSLLRLRGTVAGGSNFGLIIVDDLQERRQEVVKLGDQIKNAVLVAVARDKAVFEIGGRQETLPLFEEEAAAQATSAARPGSVLGGVERRAPSAPVRSGAPSRPPVSYRPAGPTESSVVRSLSPSRFAVDRQGLNRLAAEPEKLVGEAKIVAQSDGLLVNDIAAGGLAEKAGLLNGDKVTKINGEPVASPLQALQAYQKALKGPAVKIEVDRGGRPLTLTYELR